MNLFTLDALLFTLFFLILFRFFKPARRHGLMLVAAVLFVFRQDAAHMLLRPVFIGFTAAILYAGWAIGRRIESAEETGKKRYLKIGVALLLSPLFVFKLVQVVLPPHLMETMFPWQAQGGIGMLAPLGISYFTFRGIAYLIEIRKGAMSPVGWWHYVHYLLFWPTLMAGPIERPQAFFAQTAKAIRPTSEDVRVGLTKIFTGLFKKLIAAEFFYTLVKPYLQLASAPAMHLEKWPVWYLWICLHAYYLYLYCDFAGYSDMAIGLARLFGYRIMENFKWPILATNVADFWRRWHISLTGWITDYVYIGLGGNRRGAQIASRNTFIAMLMVGLWHGLTPHFALWGLYHAFFLNINRRMQRGREGASAPQTWPRKIFGWLITFEIINLGWVLFIFSAKKSIMIYLRLFGLLGG